MKEQTSQFRGSDNFADVFNRLKNQVVNVRVLGEWMFTGKLVGVEDDQAILADVVVTSSGGLTLSIFDVDNVAIALFFVTSVGKPVSDGAPA